MRAEAVARQTVIYHSLITKGRSLPQPDASAVLVCTCVPGAVEHRKVEPRRERRRKAAGGRARKPAKQPGAKDTTLEMTDSRDAVVIYSSRSCTGCGGDPAHAEVTEVERRQVTGVPEVRPMVTEHRSELRRWECCGTTTAGPDPWWSYCRTHVGHTLLGEVGSPAAHSGGSGIDVTVHSDLLVHQPLPRPQQRTNPHRRAI